MKVYDHVRAYIAHDDPATAMANTVAVVVGWNGPFYPLYVIWLAGRSVSASVWWAALSTPVFLAIPALARRAPRAARLALPVAGTLNTLWCIKLLGPSCGLEVFLLPCVILAALLHRRGEQGWMLGACAIPLAAYALPQPVVGAAIVAIPPAAAKAIAGLNEASVFTLAAFIAWQFRALLQKPG